MSDDKNEKNREKPVPEWRLYGDPRNVLGRYRPKKHLQTLYGKGREWTRESLAEAMGIKDPYVISKWVMGKRYMSDENIARCSLATGVSVPWLLDIADNPNSQEWPDYVAEQRRLILVGIMRFSDKRTWGGLASDYHDATEFVRDYQDALDRCLLDISGCKNMHELEDMRNNEDERDLYYHFLDNVIDKFTPPPWDVIEVYEQGEPHQRAVYADEVERNLNNLEEMFPGDHRDPVHLAHAMLDVVMKHRPAKCLEDLTNMLNQAARMARE